MSATRANYFRKHATLAPSNWRLIPLFALAAFDVWMVALLVINSWAIYKS